MVDFWYFISNHSIHSFYLDGLIAGHVVGTGHGEIKWMVVEMIDLSSGFISGLFGTWLNLIRLD